MLHSRVYKVLKPLLLLGILFTLVVKMWMTCYYAHEGGFHPPLDLNETITTKNIQLMKKGNTQSDSLGVLHTLLTGKRDGRGDGTIPSIGSDTNTTRNIKGTTEKQTRSTGYVVGVSFWDQQTYSVGNILSLQCWAGRHGMVVVEPFMIDSKFGAPLTTEAMKHNDTMVRLGRMYDLDHWNDYSKKRGYAPLVEWKEFLHRAPRNVIIVEMNRPRRSCSSNAFMLPLGFEIVKELCIEYNPHRIPSSANNFSAHVFGNFTPSNVTVIFSDWYVAMNVFVDLTQVRCQATTTHSDAISPSKEVRESAEAYIENQFSGGEYNAVMLRLEWIATSGTQDKYKKAISSCLNKTVERLDALLNHTGVKSTFVAVDVGKYGSKSSDRLNSDTVLGLVRQFIKNVYGNSSSIQQWEQTFEEISKSTSPGYIGYLQKVIATRAKCILLTGSSTSMFHKHALSMYKDLHRGTNDACYAVVNMKCIVGTSKGVALD